MRSNATAMIIISATTETSQLEYLLACETAAEMWNRLSALQKQKSESSKLLLMTRFHEYKMASEDKVALHVTKVENVDYAISVRLYRT